MLNSVSSNADRSVSEGKSGRAIDKATIAGQPAVLLTVDDVAAMLSCSTRHVRRLIDSGNCPAPVRIGSLVRLPRVAVEQWIADLCPRCR
jgi:excisionase family DNA binding protein